jgi:hypothetical protein
VGAIAGGVAGGVVGLVLVAGLGFFLAKLGAGGVAAGGFGGAGAGENPFASEMQMHAAPGSGSVPGGVYHGGAHAGTAGYNAAGYQGQGPGQGVGGYYSGGAEGAQPIQPLPHHVSYAPQAATAHGEGALQSPGQQYSHLPNSGSGSGSGTGAGLGAGQGQGVGGYYPGKEGAQAMQPLVQHASHGPQLASAGGGGQLHSPAPNSGAGSVSGAGSGTGASSPDPRLSTLSNGAGTSLPYGAEDGSSPLIGPGGLAGIGSAARRRSAQHVYGGGSPTTQGFYGFPEVQQ